MMHLFHWSKRYFVIAIIIFIIEVIIALYVHDKIIRPYIGDFLVVILLYCVLKSVVDIPALTAAIIVLLFAYCIEVLQYFKIASILRLQQNKIASIIIGSSFDWSDLVSYTLGIILVLIIEKYRL